MNRLFLAKGLVNDFEGIRQINLVTSGEKGVINMMAET